MEHQLSDEERARLGLQVDLFVDLLARRYGLQPAEVIDAVRWVQTHREFVSRIKNGGFLALFGVLISAAMLAVWEGVKQLVTGQK